MRVVAIAVVVFAIGCDAGPECGQGTAEVAGLCVAVDPDQPAACGPATAWDPNSETCLGVSHTVCGDGTSAELAGDGTTTCVGDGRPRCELACPYPDLGVAAICGRVFDADGLPLVDGRSGRLCDPASPTSAGPCAYAIDVVDPGTGAVVAADARWNDCGYLVIELAPPAGRVAVRMSVAGAAPITTEVDVVGGKRAHVRLEVGE